MGATSEYAIKRHRKYEKEMRQWYRDHGLCPRCKATITDGHVYCPDCRKRAYEEYQARYTPEQRHENGVRRRERLKAQGLCVYCGRAKAVPERVLCERCAQKVSQAQQVRKMRKRLEREATK